MTTFEAYLDAHKGTLLNEDMVAILRNIAEATRQISGKLRSSSLSGLTGATDAVNVQGETQKPLDILSNEIMLEACRKSPAVAFAVSEELDAEVLIHPTGRYAMIFDPLDGSSNLDVNVTVGTIFSIVEASSAAEILKSGRSQLAAGYAAYGPQTNLVLAIGDGVQIFTLDQYDVYVMTTANAEIVPETKEFAINAARRPSWDDVITEYVDRSIGTPGYNMRWVGSMVADTHRIFNRGGIFLYPADRSKPASGGRLRLLYEANPIGFLVEAAGGSAIAGKTAILDIEPTSLHQRVPVIFGSRQEVEKISRAYCVERTVETV
ncbi:D-fructose 1,6-bisphosphatase [Rhizobium sp. ERR 922]|uniref:class 1 fructose-bisphosphatase n=1 Tax=Rhizobium TaxID=379 RepID=UPI0011A6CF34|nr:MULTISPECIES: class 1 fructose-bisphosphatase [Rhizobium]TWB53702.1 D-fructose 1,6-bisphosphatase [Rhizobium sp. ERR 922]TWB95334.1 D-fructose 1,6-bisphosphatase [Rhizobium sp. ERR 942]GES41257.1 fructose-1,6-bisphosphatase class 1 [Rhizobium dioscoreae]